MFKHLANARLSRPTLRLRTLDRVCIRTRAKAIDRVRQRERYLNSKTCNYNRIPGGLKKWYLSYNVIHLREVSLFGPPCIHKVKWRHSNLWSRYNLHVVGHDVLGYFEDLSRYFYLNEKWQSCVISPYLFNILAEMMMRETLDGFQGGLQTFATPMTSSCIATSEAELQELVDLLDRVSRNRKYSLLY